MNIHVLHRPVVTVPLLLVCVALCASVVFVTHQWYLLPVNIVVGAYQVHFLIRWYRARHDVRRFYGVKP